MSIDSSKNILIKNHLSNKKMIEKSSAHHLPFSEVIHLSWKLLLLGICSHNKKLVTERPGKHNFELKELL